MGGVATAGAAGDAMAGVMLRLDLRRKAFGDRTLLERIALTLAAGEPVALCGPSGCGKSTLLRIVAGLDRDFEGTRHWDAGFGPDGPRLGVVPQQPTLLPWRSARDNLLLAGAAPETADTLLRRLGLAQAAGTAAARLSLGMARRVALARALAVRPDVLLLDEPFASLDPTSAATCRALLRETLDGGGVAALLVTHDPAEAVSLARHTLMLPAIGGRPEHQGGALDPQEPAAPDPH